jgi:nicotinate phosphoribosyltransferase
MSNQTSQANVTSLNAAASQPKKLSPAASKRLAARVQSKRQKMIDEFFDRLFLLGGMITATDTYKRTMGHAFRDFAMKPAAYHLTMRKGMWAKPGAGNQLIQAGHEAMLAQWFRKPLKRADIQLARDFAHTSSKVPYFPTEMWEALLADQKGSRDIYLPVDVWGFPGGQTFLAGVPSMTFEGQYGGVLSYLEPRMCNYFQPVIQATKGRLMEIATKGRFAEFGLRAALETNHLVMLLALFVGAGGKRILTSNDTAELMWPEMFYAIGTFGHEGMSSNQRLDRNLSDCELEMMIAALKAVPNARVLTDLIDAETVGLENFIKALKAVPEASEAGPRVDSGDIAKQCAMYYQRMVEEGLIREGKSPRLTVYEDEVNPEKCVEVDRIFFETTGAEPTKLFPGAGGYFWRGVHRDTVGCCVQAQRD